MIESCEHLPSHGITEQLGIRELYLPDVCDRAYQLHSFTAFIESEKDFNTQ